jgi:hypothetical protein
MNSKSGLEEVCFSGNKLGGAGLSAICSGLYYNTSLNKFAVADNMIDQTEADLMGLQALHDVIVNGTTKLTSIDLMYNRIGEPGANILIPCLEKETGNKNISEFLVDMTLPMPLFEKLYKAGGKGGKKGKKGGGKKKKKK